MFEATGLRSTLDGDDGDNSLVGGRGHHRLDWRAGDGELDDGSSTGSKVLGARLPRLLHIALPSASRGWRRAVWALAAALPLLLGAGGVAAQDTLPTVSVSDVQQDEGKAWMTFMVSLSQASRETVTVDVYTSDGTATRRTDYRSVSRKLTFPPNSMNLQQPVPVLVYDDQEVEPDETFTVTLTNPTGATLGDATATGTIRNDDTAVTLTASDIEDTTATLTISGHTDSWWYRGQDSGTSRWGTCTAVTAGSTAVGISGLTAVRTYEYTAYSDNTCTTKLAKVEFRTIAPLGTPTVSVSDVQGSEDETWMTFEVSLSTPSRDTVTVDVQTSDGTATSGMDYRSVSRKLTFPPNSTAPQHANVLVYDDQDLEPDETFTVTLTNPTGATLGDATATGTIRNDGDTAAKLAASDIGDTTATLTISGHTDSWWYRGQDSGTSRWGTCTAVAAGSTAVGISGLTAVRTYEYTAYSDSTCTTKLAKVEFRTIAPLGTPKVSVSDVRKYEDETWMTFEVSLSTPSRDTVTVDVQTSDGTATSGTDYRSVSRKLTFPANSRERQLLPVLVHDDQDLEPDETFTVTLTNPTGATLGDATATGTIRNDEAKPASGMMASNATQTTVDLTWTLPEQPRGVTVRAVGVQRQVADGTWSTVATLAAAAASHTVTGLSAETAYSFRTRLATNKGNAASEPVSATTLTAAAQDTLPTVSVSDAEAYEDGRFVHFEVSLSQASGERVTVEVATSSGTARSGTDFRAVLQTVTFPAHSTDPQSVLVSLRNDRTPEPDETFTVTLRNPVGATLGDATATGTIRNDDSAATLAASGIGETSATLTLGGHTGGWWYKGGEYATGPLGYSGQAFRILWRNVHSCTAVAAGTAAVSIGGLLAARSHDYRAYSDSTCSTRLARVKFKTLAPEGTPTVSVSDAEVSEDGKWMEFTVSLSQASRERVTVDVRTSSGTATSGADFRRVSRTLVFPANDGTPQYVNVFVHDDEELEPDETFTVTLRNPRGATLGDATATGTIRDDGDTVAMLAASDVEDTTATLTIAGHTDGWWYKGNAHGCTAVAAGTTAVSIGGLTTVTDYEYTAYSDSGCSTRLARTKFKTLRARGRAHGEHIRCRGRRGRQVDGIPRVAVPGEPRAGDGRSSHVERDSHELVRLRGPTADTDLPCEQPADHQVCACESARRRRARTGRDLHGDVEGSGGRHAGRRDGDRDDQG